VHPSRREVLATAAYASFVAAVAPFAHGTPATRPSSMRCINIVNFLRGNEPRSPIDLLLPAQEQMKLIVARRLPATWLLQFDALVDGPFVKFLQDHMPADHEVGFWFEMNQKHVEAAGVEWRGRPGLEWDSHPAVAFTIGYTPAERVKLADAAMKSFKAIWGDHPKSIASWNLDSITLAHLTDHYGIAAAAVCRDQIATDGFTIWGAPIAGYYPSKTNCWSPAAERANQIDTPIFRMLGQDPVYYYDTEFKLPDGKVIHQPDTMEPVWTSGRSPKFVDEFLKMIAAEPTLRFAYAQLGQENNFGWPEMAAAYPMQMDAIAKLRDTNAITVETMGNTGRRFKAAFTTTPTQAQVMLSDPFGNTDPAERSIWYQSRFYRANLHVKGDLAYLRDITVYSDRFAQPFLGEATREHEVHQRMPAVLDGYHWRKDGSDSKTPTAGGFFSLGETPARLSGPIVVREEAESLLVGLPIGDGHVLNIRFDERSIRIGAAPNDAIATLRFEWDVAKSSLVAVGPRRASFRFQSFDYAASISGGVAQKTANGWTVTSEQSDVVLELA
jgi:hypothetical protein